LTQEIIASSKRSPPPLTDEVALRRELEGDDSLSYRLLHGLYLVAIPWVELLINRSSFETLGLKHSASAITS
jgi:hypothetical protein